MTFIKRQKFYYTGNLEYIVPRKFSPLLRDKYWILNLFMFLDHYSVPPYIHPSTKCFTHLLFIANLLYLYCLSISAFKIMGSQLFCGVVTYFFYLIIHIFSLRSISFHNIKKISSTTRIIITNYSSSNKMFMLPSNMH